MEYKAIEKDMKFNHRPKESDFSVQDTTSSLTKPLKQKLQDYLKVAENTAWKRLPGH